MKVKHVREYMREEPVEDLTRPKRCFNCHQMGVLLYLEPHRRRTICVCTNKACFRYINIATIESWIP